MTYQDLSFLQIQYLVENACKSDLVNSFLFCVSKKASYQGVMVIMIIEMPFFLIRVSIALLYLLYSYT